jgi:hypothetical protein
MAETILRPRTPKRLPKQSLHDETIGLYNYHKPGRDVALQSDLQIARKYYVYSRLVRWYSVVLYARICLYASRPLPQELESISSSVRESLPPAPY